MKWTGSPPWTYLSTYAGYMLYLYGEAQGGLRRATVYTHTSCGVCQRPCRAGSVGLRLNRELAERECEALNVAYAARAAPGG